MEGQRLAVISDIHGNRWALEAVLRDIERRGIRSVVNLGDSLYGPLDPAGTAAILLQRDLPTVRGNEDRLIVESPSEGEVSPVLRYVRHALTAEHLQWLAALPMTMVLPGELLACHGSPRRDDQYLLWEESDGALIQRSPDELAALWPCRSETVLLCGHDHVPRTVRLPDGRLIVNPGSVGLPAYTDDSPVPHAMQTGTPHARYAVLFKDNAEWHARHVAVPYDWHAAAEAAQVNGCPDWAHWLRNGHTS